MYQKTLLSNNTNNIHMTRGQRSSFYHLRYWDKLDVQLLYKNYNWWTKKRKDEIRYNTCMSENWATFINLTIKIKVPASKKLLKAGIRYTSGHTRIHKRVVKDIKLFIRHTQHNKYTCPHFSTYQYDSVFPQTSHLLCWVAPVVWTDVWSLSPLHCLLRFRHP